MVKPKNKVYIEGYWQSEEYFKDIEKIIRTDLEIKPPTDKINVSTLQKELMKVWP